MIINGKQIAEDIKQDLKRRVSKLGFTPVLAIISVGDNPASTSFMKIKQKFGIDIGVDVEISEYTEDITTQELLDRIKILNYDKNTHGIVVQLPLPKHIDAQAVLDAVHPDADPDALGRDARVVPPVAAAVKEILSRSTLHVSGSKAVVIGKGKLVGKPVAVWLAQEGVDVDWLDEHTKDITPHLKNADLVISGAGVPGLIKPVMLKKGVVLIDAGTSELRGKLAGDADPACADIASVFTPVPGGVGPVTVAMLFRNLLELVG